MMENYENLTLEEWCDGRELSINIFNNKYKWEDETFMETIDRISGGNEKVKKLILEKKFLPGGRICANRGLDHKGRKVTMSNCYVMNPIEDNIESIFDTAKELARTFSYGGGCGIDVSKLAPNGALVNNAAKQSSGAVSFMDLYSQVTGLISQNGRRGALMISMDVNHPDIKEFIHCKSDLTRVTKANISVKIDDKFMEAVKAGGTYTCKFKRDETGEIFEREIDARKIFREIAYEAWDMAEPGVLFWDNMETVNYVNSHPEYKYAGVNPCGELALPAYGACLLGSLNLSAFVKNPFKETATFDLDEFDKAIQLATEELDIILDEGIKLHPLIKQQETASKWRPIGLGLMGIADMFIMLGIRYGSKESIELSDKIIKHMAVETFSKSVELAEAKGYYPAFNYDYITKSTMFNRIKDSLTEHILNKLEHTGIRNAQLLTIAPTGTLSTLLGISGGVEPIFANSYTRKTESLHNEDVYYKVYTPIVEQYMKIAKIDDEKDLPNYFITSQEIDFHARIDVQSAFQKYIDNSISSTINLPENTTIEDIEDLYMYAWKKGLKGVTVFRDNCRRIGVLTTEPKKEETDMDNKSLPEIESISVDQLQRGEIKKVSDDCIGYKRKLMTGCGSLHCIAMFDKHTGELLETYLSKGSTGGCNNFMVGLSRTISLAARGGICIEDIVDQLKSTGACPSYATRRATKGDTSIGACCPMAVGNAILDMYNEHNKLGKYANKEIETKPKKVEVKEPKKQEEKTILVVNEDMKCPTCGDILDHEGGCDICRSCGWTKCS